MSVSRDEVDVDGSVLWYWYENTQDYSAERTRGTYRKRITIYEKWLAARGDYTHDCHWTDINVDDVPREQMKPPRDIDETDSEAFLNDISDAFAGNTQQGLASMLSQAYEWLASQTTNVSDDPIGYVLDVEAKDILDSVDSRNPHIIPIEDVRYYIRSWNDPGWSCINQIAAKYTRRAGGISNLDIEDLNIDHPACDWTVHPEIRHWDDHILFRPDKAASDPGRNSGNKTSAIAKYPLDDELKQSLLWYLACRFEPESPTDPLFLDRSYTRMSRHLIGTRFREKSKEITQKDNGPKCWYEPGDDDNLNAHYWRHWATTWYQDQTGEDALVDYLRGDTGQGSKANYDQYSKVKRQKILKAMPKFFEPFIHD
jgi:integrase